MKKAKKRFVVNFKNDLGCGTLGTFKKLEMAQRTVSLNERIDKMDISEGYVDLHAEYWIEEVVVY